MDARAGELLPGSIYFIKQDLLLNLLRQIVKNIQEQGFKRLAIISVHSGTAQQNTLETLVKEKFKNLQVHIFPGKLFTGGIDHAELIETSLMLAINKSLVHMNRISKPMGPINVKNIDNASEKEGLQRIERIVKQIVIALQN